MRSQVFQRLFTAYRLELQLICWHWSYWLINLLFAGLMFSIFMTPVANYETAQALLMVGVGRNAVGLASLLVLFLAGISATRSMRSRFATLEMAFPIGTEVTLGRFLATVSISIPFLLSPLLIAWIAGPVSSFLRGVPVFVFEGLLTIAFSTGVVWLIQVTTSIRRWMYPAFGLLWLVASIGTVILNNDGLIVPGASLFNFARFGYGSYTETWGRLLQGDLPVYFNLFYIGLVILLVSLISWIVGQRRFYRSMPAALLSACLAAGLALFSGGIYTVTVAQDNAQIRAQWEANENNWLLPAEAPYAVKHYAIAVHLEGIPRFSVEMDILNRGDRPVSELDFTLNGQFQLTESSATYERSGNFVRILLDEPLMPNASTIIELSYSGSLRWLEPVPGAPSETTNFIRKEGVHLAYEIAWYPIAGRVSLLTSIQGRTPDVSAAIRLQVIGNEYLQFASNLPQVESRVFVSEGATWANLIGAPNLLTVRLLDGVTVIASQAELDKIDEELTQLLTEAQATVGQYFDPPNLTIILPFVRSFQLPTMYDVSLMTEGLAFFLRPVQLQFPQGQYETGIYALTRTALGDNDMTLLTENVAYFLWIQLQADGDPRQMRVLMEEKIARTPVFDEAFAVSRAMPGFATSYAITEELLRIFTENGDVQTVRVIQKMQAEFVALKDKSASEVIAWMNEVAHVD